MATKKTVAAQAPKSWNAGMSRRTFLGHLQRLGWGASFAPAVLLGLGGACPAGATGRGRAQIPGASRLADYWEPLSGTKAVRCTLCPRREVLAPGETGFCRIRENVDGQLITHGYGRPCILNIDPVGKNPLNNYLPGLELLAVAHGGCNLRCHYCQNWQYAQKSPLRTRNIEGFTADAMVTEMGRRSIHGVSFTYTEPACCPEFVSEFASFCGDHGLKRTLCSAGFIEKKPFARLVQDMDAVTITYKGADDRFYGKVTAGRLAPVRDAMLGVRSMGKWLEVATLILPTMNDDPAALGNMAKWMVSNLGADTPWILERFQPQYRLANLPPTPQRTLERARSIGLEAGLRYVYISNLAPHPGNHTYCPNCGTCLVKRMGFKVITRKVDHGTCPRCGQAIAGVWPDADTNDHQAS